MIQPILKPSQIKRKASWISYPDGPGKREVLNMKSLMGRLEYVNRTMQLWERQGKVCGLILHQFCKDRRGRWRDEEITFDHDNPRGKSGQDDRIEVDGKQQNHAVCSWCNAVKGSRRRSKLVEQGLI